MQSVGGWSGVGGTARQTETLDRQNGRWKWGGGAWKAVPLAATVGRGPGRMPWALASEPEAQPHSASGLVLSVCKTGHGGGEGLERGALSRSRPARMFRNSCPIVTPLLSSCM